MFQIIPSVANVINVVEIVKSHVEKEQLGSPSGFRKFLGRGGGEVSVDKFVSTSSLLTSVGTQRKYEPVLPKDVLSAIDHHVIDVKMSNSKSLVDLIYKLSDICTNEIHLVR
jgi:hypothetical protein